ncbi:TOTE conflict system archaeo-eukaryotic primase domain-containing protein [Paraburkholderia sp. 32]|uniref:TOTE conflict system archaeo-eukaryotic primase domain-containing protein n=1 Tax=Paraburkholderia sp. 32 TaxID=2991057 RepID=UPI003D204422
MQLFRRLFRGRTDVYPLRWESRNSGKSGYAPVCANEWRAGICEKPRIRCADCTHRVLLSLDDQVFYAHLSGDRTVGLYPLMADGTCYLLAVDFDDESWRDDAMAFRQLSGLTCASLCTSKALSSIATMRSMPALLLITWISDRSKQRYGVRCDGKSA